MKSYITGVILAIAVLFGATSAALASATLPLTALRSVNALSRKQASEELPVAFEATVTYLRGFDHLMFVQDGEAAIFVLAPAQSKLHLGDRILVQGTTRDSFRPFVVASEITLLHSGALPEPVPATFNELMRAKYDCRMVVVHGIVRSADLEMITGAPTRSMNLQILTEGGYIEVSIDSDKENALKDLLDAEVEVSGVSAGKFDNKKQQTGAMLHVSTLGEVRTLKAAGVSPRSLPITPMDEVISGYHVRDLTKRIRVQGTITYAQAGSAVVLQNGDKSLWIMTRSLTPMRVGDVVEATGFPDVHDGSLVLTRGEIEKSQTRATVTAQPSTWEEMTMRGVYVRGHIFDLVSIEGIVATEEREASQDEYVLSSEGHVFSAIYRHPEGAVTAELAPMKMIPPGSKVRITGICIVESFNPSDNRDHDSFDILLNSVDDIRVIAKPSWLSIRNLSYLASALLIIVLSSGGWGWSLTAKVRRQSKALATRIEAEAALERRMAQIEQRRSRILEDINGSKSLAHILGEITELVTFLLNGAPCWCGIRDELNAGFRPAQMDGMRTLEVEIAAGSGPLMGLLIAGFDEHTPHSADEQEALNTGARLAMLAIENRRLYEDLRHRSEHDLLTDLPNRFRHERQIDILIERASHEETAFGLIYIDLDRFKQVNDSYGHRAGDLYLQEATRRMKLQLRSEDMLARVGGDEFIALVPIRRNRGDAEEIATRLERCFDESFVLEGIRLRGSASIGLAMYPEDGTCKEELQRSADATMYLHKQSKRSELQSAVEAIAS